MIPRGIPSQLRHPNNTSNHQPQASRKLQYTIKFVKKRIKNSSNCLPATFPLRSQFFTSHIFQHVSTWHKSWHKSSYINQIFSQDLWHVDICSHSFILTFSHRLPPASPPPSSLAPASAMITVASAASWLISSAEAAWTTWVAPKGGRIVEKSNGMMEISWGYIHDHWW